MAKYSANLNWKNNKVFSYDTYVADIDHSNKKVIALGWWSMTTQKHINYVAEVFGYEVVKSNEKKTIN